MSTSPTTSTRLDTREQVMEAVCDLNALGKTVTRETVSELTGLKLTTVDDRLGVLCDDGRLRRVLRGVYQPVVLHPPARPISKTVLADGMVKIEIGDEVLTLTPREDRMLGLLQAGAALQAAQVGGS